MKIDDYISLASWLDWLSQTFDIEYEETKARLRKAGQDGYRRVGLRLCHLAPVTVDGVEVEPEYNESEKREIERNEKLRKEVLGRVVEMNKELASRIELVRRLDASEVGLRQAVLGELKLIQDLISWAVWELSHPHFSSVRSGDRSYSTWIDGVKKKYDSHNSKVKGGEQCKALYLEQDLFRELSKFHEFELKRLSARVKVAMEDAGKAAPREQRDAWLYSQAIEGIEWPEIHRRLLIKIEMEMHSWPSVRKWQSVKKRAEEYQRKHKLPEIAKRRPGRRPKKLN